MHSVETVLQFLNFDLFLGLQYAVWSSRDAGWQQSQLPVSHTTKRGNNQHTDNHSATRQPLFFTFSTVLNTLWNQAGLWKGLLGTSPSVSPVCLYKKLSSPRPSSDFKEKIQLMIKEVENAETESSQARKEITVVEPNNISEFFCRNQGPCPCGGRGLQAEVPHPEHCPLTSPPTHLKKATHLAALTSVCL